MMHLHRVGGVEIGLETIGRPEDPPVVLLHGFAVDHRVLRAPMERLFARRPGWRRVYVDLPGFGIAPGSDAIGGTDDVLAVVLELLADVAGPRRAAIIGLSWGGYLAYAAAAARPELVAGFAMLCPMIVPEHAARDVPDVTRPEIPPDVVAGADPDVVAEFREIAVVADAEQFAFFRDEIYPALRDADEATMDRIAARYGVPWTIDPSVCTSPALLVTGRQDWIVGYRDAWRLAEQLPQATFAVLDGAGHGAHVEREEIVAALLGRWLDEAAPTA